MQIVKLNVPVPSIGLADIHVRTERLPRFALPLSRPIHEVVWAAAYDRAGGRWVLPETPESVQELLDAAKVVLR